MGKAEGCLRDRRSKGVMEYPKLTLVYFTARAKAEAPRMLLEYGCIPYEDVTVDEFWGNGPAAYQSEAAFGQLPLLDVDGQQIVQSGSICRYCASLVPGLV